MEESLCVSLISCLILIHENAVNLLLMVWPILIQTSSLPISQSMLYHIRLLVHLKRLLLLCAIGIDSLV